METNRERRSVNENIELGVEKRNVSFSEEQIKLILQALGAFKENLTEDRDRQVVNVLIDRLSHVRF